MATDVSQPEPETEEAAVAPSEAQESRSEGKFQAISALIARAAQLATPGRLKIAGGATAALLVIAMIAYWQTREEGKTNAEFLKDALRLLDNGDNARAWRIALSLQQIGYQDPDFPGGDQFILGMVAFRQANELSEDEGREQKFLAAKDFLEEAEKRAITDKRKPQLAYALGVSLHRIGRALAAKPFLIVAAKSYPPGKIEASLLLVDTYLYSKTAEDLKQAQKLIETVLAMPDLSPEQQDLAQIQRAQILYAQGKSTEAEKSLAKVKTVTHAITVLRAEALMYDEKWNEALEMLRPVEEDDGLQKKYPRQARYLMGVCKQRLAEGESHPEKRAEYLDEARNYYERTFKRFHGSHEALAAQLWAADVLRKQEFHEKALETYNDTLRQVYDPREFSNQWIDIKVFRKAILDAWNTWNALHMYQYSLALTIHMSPLFPPEQSHKYAALASEKSAEYFENELKSKPYAQRRKRQAELRKRWVRSGQAFSALAALRKTTADYPDDLWTSAEYFIKGHDYAKANSQLKKFIDTNPTKRLPMALVRKGKVLMDLNDFENALTHLERVVQRHPTDQVVFQARYLIGKCYYETNQIDKAEQTWRKMLVSNNLTPAASEWQNALFGLGKLLYLSAVEKSLRSKETMKTDPAAGMRQSQEAFRRWDEAIVRLEEFLNRYDSENDHRAHGGGFESEQQQQKIIEARYYLAKSSQRRAELPREKLKTAETDNARDEYFAQMKQLLDQSNQNFSRLKTDLLLLSDRGQIDEIGLELLRKCHFEIPDNYFTFQDYTAALKFYGEAAGLYLDHPDALRAMVQQANCYDRLGSPLDARSALGQTKFMLKQIPDTAFEGEPMSKEQWRKWLDWAIELHK